MENNRQNVLNELIEILDKLAYVKSDEIPNIDFISFNLSFTFVTAILSALFVKTINGKLDFKI